MIYLACPYTHDKELVRAGRVEVATRWAAGLFPLTVFSPITHGYAVEQHLEAFGKESCYDDWIRNTRHFLRHSSSMMVLMLPGVTESKGVNSEIAVCHTLSIPIETVSWETIKAQPQFQTPTHTQIVADLEAWS